MADLPLRSLTAGDQFQAPKGIVEGIEDVRSGGWQESGKGVGAMTIISARYS
jgi:hypothetical protein